MRRPFGLTQRRVDAVDEANEANTLVNGQTNSRLSFGFAKLGIMILGLEAHNKHNVNT